MSALFDLRMRLAEAEATRPPLEKAEEDWRLLARAVMELAYKHVVLSVRVDELGSTVDALPAPKAGA